MTKCVAEMCYKSLSDSRTKNTYTDGPWQVNRIDNEDGHLVSCPKHRYFELYHYGTLLVFVKRLEDGTYSPTLCRDYLTVSDRSGIRAFLLVFCTPNVKLVTKDSRSTINGGSEL